MGTIIRFPGSVRLPFTVLKPLFYCDEITGLSLLFGRLFGRGYMETLAIK
jgi:hypothetical protein